MGVSLLRMPFVTVLFHRHLNLRVILTKYYFLSHPPTHDIQVILGAGQLFQAQQDLLHRTAPLLLSYYLIKWGSQCLATDVPVDTL